jgi:ribonuclease BN (tRNA processing enzyme)
LAKGADLLVSEIIDVDATVANVRRNNPSLTGPAFDGLVQHLVRHHLTPEQVGELASAAGVKVVVLTHQVPGSSDPADLVRYKAGVNKHFNGHVFVANDLDSF